MYVSSKTDDKKSDSKPDSTVIPSKIVDIGADKSSAAPAAKKAEEESHIMKKVIKGAAPVDDYCTR